MQVNGCIQYQKGSGEGGIRTLDPEDFGMPVFETGAFNRSATSPERRHDSLSNRPALVYIGSDAKKTRMPGLFILPVLIEKRFEQGLALRLQDTAGDLHLMVEPRIPAELVERAAATGLFVPGAEHYP